MPYETGMATRSMYHSVATGEGLMCHFMGPGTLYLQSHKPDEGGGGDGGSSTNRRRPARPATGAERAFGLCFVCVFLSIFVSVFGFAAYQFIMEGGEYTVNGQPRHFEGYASKKSGARARVRDSLGDGYSGGGSKGNRRRGDLLFWKGHVGVLLSPDELLHANGHTMSVAREPVAEALSRISKVEWGALTGWRRLR